MTEETKTESFVLPVHIVNWLNEQKTVKGINKSFYVEKGLRLIIGIEQISKMKYVFIPLIQFLVCQIVFIFVLIFYTYLPLWTIIFMMIIIFFFEGISFFVLYRGIKLLKQKKIFGKVLT